MIVVSPQSRDVHLILDVFDSAIYESATALSDVPPRQDLIALPALAGITWKDTIPRANVVATWVIVMTTPAMMLVVVMITPAMMLVVVMTTPAMMLVVVTAAHVVPIVMMVVTLHVVVTAAMPSGTATSSMCLRKQ